MMSTSFFVQNRPFTSYIPFSNLSDAKLANVILGDRLANDAVKIIEKTVEMLSLVGDGTGTHAMTISRSSLSGQSPEEVAAALSSCSGANWAKYSSWEKDTQRIFGAVVQTILAPSPPQPLSSSEELSFRTVTDIFHHIGIERGRDMARITARGQTQTTADDLTKNNTIQIVIQCVFAFLGEVMDDALDRIEGNEWKSVSALPRNCFSDLNGLREMFFSMSLVHSSWNIPSRHLIGRVMHLTIVTPTPALKNDINFVNYVFANELFLKLRVPFHGDWTSRLSMRLNIGSLAQLDQRRFTEFLSVKAPNVRYLSVVISRKPGDPRLGCLDSLWRTCSRMNRLNSLFVALHFGGPGQRANGWSDAVFSDLPESFADLTASRLKKLKLWCGEKNLDLDVHILPILSSLEHIPSLETVQISLNKDFTIMKVFRSMIWQRKNSSSPFVVDWCAADVVHTSIPAMLGNDRLAREVLSTVNSLEMTERLLMKGGPSKLFLTAAVSLRELKLSLPMLFAYSRSPFADCLTAPHGSIETLIIEYHHLADASCLDGGSDDKRLYNTVAKRQLPNFMDLNHWHSLRRIIIGVHLDNKLDQITGAMGVQPNHWARWVQRMKAFKEWVESEEQLRRENLRLSSSTIHCEVEWDFVWDETLIV